MGDCFYHIPKSLHKGCLENYKAHLSMNWVEETGIKVGFFIAGCAGALVSFLKPQELSWKERVLTFVAGGLSAMYLTPVTIMGIESVRPISPSAEFAVAFLIGYSGLKGIEFTIAKIKDRFKKN
jgi:hypothetical protein